MASSGNQPTSAPVSLAPGEKNLASIGPWSLLETACAIFVLFAVAYGLVVASHWPLVHDEPLMHYVVFLMDKGWAPYRDIIEMNMPGSYMQAWVVIHVLGNGAHGWFLWDALTGLTSILAGAWIMGPGRRSAGLIGGGLAYLMHLSDGAWNEGQRDWLVAVLLLLAFGCVFQFLRSEVPGWIAGMVSFSVFATTIKPLVIVAPFVLLGIIVWLRHREEKNIRPLAWAAFLGIVPPLLAITLFLSHWGVWGEFYSTLRGVVALYASLHNLSLIELWPVLLPHPVAALGLGGLALFFVSRSWRTPESGLLLLGASFGVFFFLLQRKGWSYHQYTTVAFLLVWIALEVHSALHASTVSLRYAAAVIMMAATLWLPLRCIAFERRSIYPMDTEQHLEKDLIQLGGSQLSGQVQCLDMALGSCINSLYRLKLVQSTGFIYDFYLFPLKNTKLTEKLQAKFLTDTEIHPPRVFVLSSQDFATATFGYQKLDRWPALRDRLKTEFDLSTTFQSDPDHPSLGYRIYVRKQATSFQNE